MSHITIIISKSAPATTVADSAENLATSYEYCIPVPHGATPLQVGEMVRKAYKKLEAWEPQAEA